MQFSWLNGAKLKAAQLDLVYPGSEVFSPVTPYIPELLLQVIRDLSGDLNTCFAREEVTPPAGSGLLTLVMTIFTPVSSKNGSNALLLPLSLLFPAEAMNFFPGILDMLFLPGPSGVDDRVLDFLIRV